MIQLMDTCARCGDTKSPEYTRKYWSILKAGLKAYDHDLGKTVDNLYRYVLCPPCAEGFKRYMREPFIL